MENGRFRCDRCGLCCRLIGNIPQLSQFDRGDGVCCHLTDENLCDIYDSRPEVCSVDSMYSRVSDSMTRVEYERMMMDSCKVLKKNFKTLQEQRIAGSGRVPADKSSFARDFDGLSVTIPVKSLEKLAQEVGVYVNREDA